MSACCIVGFGCVWGMIPLWAGAQKEEALADSVRGVLRESIALSMPTQRPFASAQEQQEFAYWQAQMRVPLRRFVADESTQNQLLSMIDYEAYRAGLEPALVLAVIEVESRFNPRAVSPAQARGLMQVMPFWTRVIGDGQVNQLNHARINVRYGCVILRHYLDQERGDVARALARYNGSLGRMTYANKVFAALRFWR